MLDYQLTHEKCNDADNGDADVPAESTSMAGFISADSCQSLATEDQIKDEKAHKRDKIED